MRSQPFNTLLFFTIVLEIAFFVTSCDDLQKYSRKPDINEVEKVYLANCPPTGQFYDVKTNINTEAELLTFKNKLREPGMTVRLGPDVVVDFSTVKVDSTSPTKDFFPIYFGRCVTLTSVSKFPDEPQSTGNSENAPGHLPDTVATEETLNNSGPTVTEARTTHSRGPILKFGKHRSEPLSFLGIRCNSQPGEGRLDADYARISGFRLIGPEMGPQPLPDFGISVNRCTGVEIYNMEIAGWGGAGIYILDEGPDQPLNSDLPDHGRIMNPEQIEIHDNFIHNNQRSTSVDCGFKWPPCGLEPTSGYGVDINVGAWAHIHKNVFDFNRHSISASGDSGGYRAEYNLVLKGGGMHWQGFTTHSFDIHGTGKRGFGGDAGNQFWFIANSFQFRKDNAIKIRGTPRIAAYISENIFPHPGREDDSGDDAIYIESPKVNVNIGPSNEIKFDSFGLYGVCDFDGDFRDDLFLPTGASWWFSGQGEFPWTFLNVKRERLEQLRLGYFDGDLRCDVLAEQNDGQWVISSGGTSDWKPLGAFGVPLSEVQFGRFDPTIRDYRPGATRHTSHAFRRAPDDQWYVTSLSAPNWQPVASSGFPMNKLRFGDFTGDGVTDVLTVENGHWAISESAILPWRRINPTLGDDVENVIIANMDRDDNIDDILRLEVHIDQPSHFGANAHAKLKWWRSKNGNEPWRPWKSYNFVYYGDNPKDEIVDPRYGFAGRFGVYPGGATLVIDPYRIGQFYGEAVITTGARPDWPSTFAY